MNIKTKNYMKLRVGMIVNYKTTADDQKRMNERRSICNVAAELPAVVVAVHSDSMVNLNVLYDGAGNMWAASVLQGDGEGNWNFYPGEEKEFSDEFHELIDEMLKQKAEIKDLLDSVQEDLEELKSVFNQIHEIKADFKPAILVESAMNTSSSEEPTEKVGDGKAV